MLLYHIYVPVTHNGWYCQTMHLAKGSEKVKDLLSHLIFLPVVVAINRLPS